MQAIVIGAGIGGIATAIRLSNIGYEVRVMEANSYPGGKLTAFEQEGFRFDAGPSLFTMPHLIEELIQSTGRKPENYLQYKALYIACEYFYADGTRLTAYCDKEKFFAEAADKLGADTGKLDRYLKKAAFTFNTSAKIFLEKSLHKLGTFLSKDVLYAVVNSYKYDVFKSMHQANTDMLGNDKLVQLFDRFATYNGSNPYTAPGILNAIAHLEVNENIYYPIGGMHQITLGLYKLAKEMGVQFNFNEKALKIETDKKKASGVQTDQGNYRADLVVSNMDIVPTYRKLLSHLKAPEFTLKQERSSSALIFYWGMNRQFEQLNAHNIFFSADYKQEFDHIFKHKTVSKDPTVYVSITSKYNVSDAPEGHENWFVMINVPANNGQDWTQIKNELRLATIKKISGALGHDISKHIVTEQILDPVGIEEKTSSYMGALYGASSNNRFAAFLRHPNFSRQVKNLYFCGGSVHPGGGIPLCLLSAKIIGELVSNEKK